MAQTKLPFKEGELVLLVKDKEEENLCGCNEPVQQALLGRFLRREDGDGTRPERIYGNFTEIQPATQLSGRTFIPVIQPYSKKFIPLSEFKGYEIFTEDEVRTKGFSSKAWLFPYISFMEMAEEVMVPEPREV